MQTFIQVINGVAVGSEISIPDSTSIDDCYPPSVAATFISCPAGTAEGSTYSNNTFTPPSAVLTKAQLMAYANGKLNSLRALSHTYDLGGVSITADATADTIALVNGLYGWGSTNPAATQPWVDNAGTVTTITGAQAVTLYGDGLVYVQSLYVMLASAMTGIAAATITTTAEIDALNWPT